MPKVDNLVDTLKPYVFHGLDVSHEVSGGEVLTDCPFCGRDRKLSIQVANGQWRCFVCQIGSDRGGGNATTFMRLLHEHGMRSTAERDYEELAHDRRLLYTETLKEWGWCKSPINGKWLIPGRDADWAIRTLYMRADKLYPTPTLGSWVFGPLKFNAHGPLVVNEGPYDGQAFYEVMTRTKGEPGNFSATADREHSIGAKVGFLAVPGCGSVGEPVKRWADLANNRVIELYFDSDHPKQHLDRISPPAGYEALKRATALLHGRAKQILYLHWGDQGYNPELPHGYDLRDQLTGQKGTAPTTLLERVDMLDWVVNNLRAAPEAWADSKVQSAGIEQPDNCLKCSSYKELTNAWKKALKWTWGLDCALSSMLSSVLSTQLVGEQLWFEIIGPPSSGKTTLMEGISMNKQYVLSKDTIRGFYSGWRTEGGEDSSLIVEAAGKTLAMKEGDAFVKAPNVQQILSEGRGIYDRVGRNHYRNSTANDYEGYRMTWLICGTSAIREEIDSSELGARFLACVVMEGIDDEFEDDVLWRAVNQESRAMVIESEGDMASQYPPELVRAMQLTGGYVSHLRRNAAELVAAVELSEEVLRWCGRLGKFVAYMRAKPTKKDDYQEREFSARLAKQMVRLSKSKAAVIQQSGASLETLKRVKKIALDTARGLTLTIVNLLRQAPNGMDAGAIILRTNQQVEKVNKLLRFLRAIGVVEVKSSDAGDGLKKNVRKAYHLTEPLKGLYDAVHSDES